MYIGELGRDVLSAGQSETGYFSDTLTHTAHSSLRVGGGINSIKRLPCLHIRIEGVHLAHQACFLRYSAPSDAESAMLMLQSGDRGREFPLTQKKSTIRGLFAEFQVYYRRSAIQN